MNENITKAIVEVENMLDRQIGDKPRPLDVVNSLAIIQQVKATLLVAQELERIADILDSFTSEDENGFRSILAHTTERRGR